jgi:hypothetical protein
VELALTNKEEEEEAEEAEEVEEEDKVVVVVVVVVEEEEENEEEVDGAGKVVVVAEMEEEDREEEKEDGAAGMVGAVPPKLIVAPAKVQLENEAAGFGGDGLCALGNCDICLCNHWVCMLCNITACIAVSSRSGVGGARECRGEGAFGGSLFIRSSAEGLASLHRYQGGGRGEDCEDDGASGDNGDRLSTGDSECIGEMLLERRSAIGRAYRNAGVV